METFKGQGMRIDPSRAFKIENLLEIQRELSHRLLLSAQSGNLDMLSLSIARAVDPQCRLAAIIQAAYAIRRSELHEIDLQKILDGLPQIIWQSKVSTMRPLPIWPGMIANEKINCNMPAALSMVSLAAYERALRVSIPKFILDAIPNEQHVTHVFRHLRATFIFKKTQSTEAVQEYFGHRDPSVSRDYVHTSLLPYV